MASAKRCIRSLHVHAVCAALLAALLAAPRTQAVEFRSIGIEAALLYDGPAPSANRVAILTRQYPVEVISQAGGWVKVRDAVGQVLWVEAKALDARRTVLVVVHVAEARAAPDANAPLVFRAEQQVALELLDAGTGAWVKVRHRDGASGYMRAEQLWGL